MKISTDNYVCSVCGRRDVKLWRPYGDTYPLICAECAEKMQAHYEYDEVIWFPDGEKGYKGRFTGNTIPLPKWTVDDDGLVPSYEGPGPEGVPERKTDQLIVDLSSVSEVYKSGQTCMIPAAPVGNNSFWGYMSVPEEVCKWWKELPTK